jgi:MFS transporter, AAHS family, 4-hydroxybenzoate transporter
MQRCLTGRRRCFPSATVLGMLARDSGGTIGLKTLIDQGTWSTRQIAALILICLTMLFDGVDQLVLSMAMPAVARDWHLAPGAFGAVISVGLAGVGLGTLFGGALGDRMGRKRLLIYSVGTFSVFTLVSAASRDMTFLLWARFLSGWGLGSAIPNATTLVSEITPRRRAGLAITLAAASIPLGGVVGGILAKNLLPEFGWRALFSAAGVAPLIICLLLTWLLPESPQFLLRDAKPAGRLTAVLAGFKIAVPANTVIVNEDAGSAWGDVRDLFRNGVARDSVALWASFIFIMTTGLLMANWIPTILSLNGFSLRFTSQGILFYTLGGTAGAVTIATLIRRFSSRVIILFGLIAAATAASLGMAPSLAGLDQRALLALLTLIGFCNTGILSPLFALAAHIYPSHVRGTGTAAATALGRVGAIAGTFVAAKVIGGAQGVSILFLIACGLLLCCALSLALLRNHIPKSV